MLKNSLFYSLILTSPLALELCANKETKETAVCGESPRPMRVIARHIEANGIGYDQGYTTVEGFFSTSKPWNWIPFLDLRGHVFNNGKLAANAGLGLRYMGCSRVWGANAYYDYRNTKHRHYNQVAMGLESLGRVWDFRLNGYLPVGEKKSRFYHTEFDKFQGNQLIIKRKREFAMKGANAEAGLHVDTIKHVPFYFAAGPYYLEGQGKVAWGGELRAIVDLYDYIRLEGNTSYDKVFKWIGQGQVSVVVPFGPKRRVRQGKRKSCSLALALSERALQRVDRFEIIPVDKKYKRTPAIDPATGDPYVFWFVDNTSHSAGTFESPFNTLAAAESASSPYDVIYIFPGDGTSTGMSSGITLQNNQKLFGASIVQTLPTTMGTIQIPTFASTLPVLTNTNSSGVIDIVDVRNNNEISGLCLNADFHTTGDNIGQATSSINNFTAANNTILNVGNSNGITLNNASGSVIIANNNFNTFQGVVIQITDTGVQNTVYSITDNLMSSSNGTYVINMALTDCSNTSTLISGNTLIPGYFGINAILSNTSAANVSNPIIIQNNSIISQNFEDIYVELDNYAVSSVVIQNNSLASGNNGGPNAAIDIQLNNNSVAPVLIQNNQVIAGTDGVYILVQESATVPLIAIQNNTINAQTNGIEIDVDTLVPGTGGTVSATNIQNNTITASSDGILLNFANSTSIGPTYVAILNNTINTATVSNVGINSSIVTAGTASLAMLNNVINQSGNSNPNNIYFNNTGTATVSCFGNTITSSQGNGSGGGLSIQFDPNVGQATVAVQNNTIFANGETFGITGHNAEVTLAISDNVFTSATNGVVGIATPFGATTLLSGYITNNQLTGAAYANAVFFLDWYGSVPSLVVANNNMVGYAGSEYITFGAESDITIQNNTFNQGGLAILHSAGLGKYHVVGNAFPGSLGEPVFVANENNASTMCLRLNDNTTDIYPRAYTLSTQNGPNSTFYYEPLQGNVGQVFFQGAGKFIEVPAGNCD